MFGAIAVVLLILWAVGYFALHMGTPLIHALMIIAVILVVWRLATMVTTRRTWTRAKDKYETKKGG